MIPFILFFIFVTLIYLRSARSQSSAKSEHPIEENSEEKINNTVRLASLKKSQFVKKKHDGRVALNIVSVDDFIKDIPIFEKSDEERKMIGEALEENFIFNKLPYLNDLVSAFEKILVKDGEVIIQEGDDADYFYVIGSGLVEFMIQGKNVGCRGEGEYFGDLALLRNCKRAATCVTSEDCVLWRLDQRTYRAVVARNRTGDLTAIVKMLKKVPLFSSLSEHAVLSKIATAMEERTYEKGDILMKKGDIGSEMHIIKSGKILLKDIEAKGRTYEDVELTTGDFFGERAVLESEPRAATAVAVEKSTIYCISKDSFVKHIGSMDKLKRDATYFRLLKTIPFFANSNISSSEYEELISRIENVTVAKGEVIYEENEKNDKLYLIETGEVLISKGPKNAQNDVLRTEKLHFGEDHFLQEDMLATETVTAKVDTVMGVLYTTSLIAVIRAIRRLDQSIQKGQQFGVSEAKLSDLHRHRILGIGAFGRVWLVSQKNEKGEIMNDEVYALKVQKKRQLLDNKMTKAIIREAAIIKSLDHPFVLSLLNVYHNEHEVFFVTNFIQGGELYRLLNVDGEPVALPPNDARFYAAGVFEGLNHMHTRGIIYRDLKPENVLIGEDGYPVLVDFGFAKKLEENKAFTMCGSPFYIAPEVLLGTGHDKSFDHWAWAIMVHELLSGDVPFKGSAKASQIKLYKAIARGKFKMSDLLDDAARDLVKKILVIDVTGRLGSLAGGVMDIKNHDWLKEIDFDMIGAKIITPPWVPEVKSALDCSEFEDFSHEEFESEHDPSDNLTEEEIPLFDALDHIMAGGV